MSAPKRFLKEDFPHRFERGSHVGVCARCRRFRRAWNCANGPVYLLAQTIRYVGDAAILLFGSFAWILLFSMSPDGMGFFAGLFLATCVFMVWHYAPWWPEPLEFGVLDEIRGTYSY